MGASSPLIGITAQFLPEGSSSDPARFEGLHKLPEVYMRAVRLAGGLPMLIPIVPEFGVAEAYLERLDGLILPGGGDIDAYLFDEEPHPHLGTIDPHRDCFETELLRLALSREMPILGICRGMQLLNIVAGGGMVQDIGSQIKNPIQHSQKAPLWYNSHRVALTPESLAARLMETDSLRTNSYHHQAIVDAAPGFFVSGRTVDGVAEALESLEHRFVLGVQFHPEGMIHSEPRVLGIFRGLVQACAPK